MQSDPQAKVYPVRAADHETRFSAGDAGEGAEEAGEA